MCGISGIINLNNQEVEQHIIKSFNDIISHRGPDDDGFYLFDNLALGHRRLSILDLSISGHQPMHYKDNYTIVFNGEIYNYLEIREELIDKGYSFTSNTDTEVILAAYDCWSETCVEKFNGMWAFALLDKAKKKLFCSRDRFGVKPFYYRISNTYFSFSSEIKQKTTLPDWKPRLNTTRAIDFIRHGIFDHTDETLFSDVKQLRGGHNLVFDLTTNNYTVTQWYNLRERVSTYAGSFESAKKDFYRLFTDAIKLRLRSDVKVGSCLSGGLDSTSIVCVVNNILRDEGKHDIQETVSACYEEKKYDEQQYIDQVVEATDVTAHKVYPDLTKLSQILDQLVWHQDEPFSSSSIFAQWCVFEEAKRNGLIVMLDGQGADESLAGYPPFHDAYLTGLLKAFEARKILAETNALRTLKGYSATKAWQFVAKALLPHSLTLRLRDNVSPILHSSIQENQDFFWPQYFDNIKEMSLDQLCVSNLPMLLHYEDRNSMAHSIESRVPFLDYRVVEFIVSLPDEYKIDNGKSKYVLREALADTIPATIKNRHDKMGFVTPEAVWIKRNKEQVRNELVKAGEDLKQLINIDKVLSTFDYSMQKGQDIAIGSVYFRLLTFYRWVEKFNIILN